MESSSNYEFKSSKEVLGISDAGSWGTIYRVLDKDLREVCVTRDETKANRFLEHTKGGTIIATA